MTDHALRRRLVAALLSTGLAAAFVLPQIGRAHV